MYFKKQKSENVDVMDYKKKTLSKARRVSSRKEKALSFANESKYA